MTIEVNNLVKAKISQKFIRQFIKKVLFFLKPKRVGDLEISVAIVDQKIIRHWNKIYRGKNQTTDILSFSFGGEGIFKKKTTWQLIICWPALLKQAKERGHSREMEFKTLLIHGILHILGYNHQKIKEAKRMAKIAAKILKHLRAVEK